MQHLLLSNAWRYQPGKLTGIILAATASTLQRQAHTPRYQDPSQRGHENKIHLRNILFVGKTVNRQYEMATQREITYITPATLNLCPVFLPTQTMLPSNPAQHTFEMLVHYTPFHVKCQQNRNYKHSDILLKQRLHCTNVYAQELQWKHEAPASSFGFART